MGILQMMMVFLMVNFVQNYDLDKSRSRTSSMIKEGSLKIALDDEPNDGAYNLYIDAKMKLLFGSRKWQTVMKLPEGYFTDEFWTELEQEGEKYLESCTVVYVKNLGSNCHRVLMKDLQEVTGDLRSNDVTIRADVCRDIKGLGARTIDVSGTESGYFYKAGFDLK